MAKWKSTPLRLPLAHVSGELELMMQHIHMSHAFLDKLGLAWILDVTEHLQLCLDIVRLYVHVTAAYASVGFGFGSFLCMFILFRFIFFIVK